MIGLPPRLAKWATEFVAAEQLSGVDAYVLAAICDRESLGGDALTPRGPGGTGDKGNGHGLMQIDGRYHRTFVAALGADGVPLWKRPAFNILYAAKEVLAVNLNRFGGEYAPAIAAYNASARRVADALNGLPVNATEADKIAALDSVTTGKNYVSSVLASRDRFLMSQPTA